MQIVLIPTMKDNLACRAPLEPLVYIKTISFSLYKTSSNLETRVRRGDPGSRLVSVVQPERQQGPNNHDDQADALEHVQYHVSLSPPPPPHGQIRQTLVITLVKL